MERMRGEGRRGVLETGRTFVLECIYSRRLAPGARSCNFARLDAKSDAKLEQVAQHTGNTYA